MLSLGLGQLVSLCDLAVQLVPLVADVYKIRYQNDISLRTYWP